MGNTVTTTTPPGQAQPAEESYEDMTQAMAYIELATNAVVAEIEKEQAQVALFIKMEQKETAMIHLRSKKKREMALLYLTELQASFNDIVDHVRSSEVLTVGMKASINAIGILRKMATLVNADEADDIHEKLEEQQVNIHETQRIMTRSRRGLFPRHFDEAELERELADIMTDTNPDDAVVINEKAPTPPQKTRSVSKIPEADLS